MQKAKDGWWICNLCQSWDANGKLREYKCRTTNPDKFNLCDKKPAPCGELECPRPGYLGELCRSCIANPKTLSVGYHDTGTSGAR